MRRIGTIKQRRRRGDGQLVARDALRTRKARGTAPLLFGPQRLKLRDDGGPVVGLAHPGQRRRPHAGAQVGVAGQIEDTGLKLGHVNFGHGGSRGAILAVIVDAALQAQAFIGQMQRAKGAGGDAKADIGGDGIFQPVPIGHQTGQTGGHAFQGGEAEGFLNVVDHEQKDIGAGQGGAAIFGPGTVQQQKADIGHQGGGTLGKDIAGIGVTKDAAEHDMQLLPRLQRLLGGLHGDVDRQRVKLLMRGQAGDGGKDHIIGAATKPGAQGGAGGGVAGVIIGVNAKRDHRQHGPGGRVTAEAGADVAVDQIHLGGDRGANRVRGADHRVPIHHRGHAQVEKALHDAHGRGGMGDARDGPGCRTAVGAAPRL